MGWLRSSSTHGLTLILPSPSNHPSLQLAKQPGYVAPLQRPESSFLPTLLDEFLDVLGQAVEEHEQDGSYEHGGPVAVQGTTVAVLKAREVSYCERFMEFLVDLLSQLPTRR
jgi:intron-binding protein aquarius